MDDLNLVQYPKIYIDETANVPPGVLPHMERDRSFCYLETGSEILDLYNPDRAIVYCLDVARQAIEASIRGRLDVDIAAEFASYWSRDSVLVNLPKIPASGQAKIVMNELRPGYGDFTFLIGDEGMPSGMPRRQQPSSSVYEVCHILQTEKPFTVESGTKNWPPATLETLLDWLEGYFGKIDAIWDRICKSGKGDHWWIALVAPNGIFLARVSLPAEFRKPEFIKNRRDELSKILSRAEKKVSVDRYVGSRIDAEFVFGRNLEGRLTLKDKKILLIGCGTIGGFLAHNLAQSGAGVGTHGSLTLVDKDYLATSNLGRHFLGIGYLMMNKAEACRIAIAQSLPYVKIKHLAANALDLLESMTNYDLVIDATGNEALSLVINDFVVRKRLEPAKHPPVLHSWITATGGAAVAMFCDDLDHACFKCLKPDLDAQPNIRIARDVNAIVRNQSCGDAPYTPFPVSSSTQAAGLALEICLDWVNGSLGKRLRVRTFDERKAFKIKDGNLLPSKSCPACRR